MTTLHIISHRLDADTLASLQRSLNLGDSLLLSCDGVYLALQRDFAATASCAALTADISARGLDALWPAAIPRVDHAGFVTLCVEHHKTVSWS
jgi:sulfur relay protein TusB/DsrH